MVLASFVWKPGMQHFCSSTLCDFISRPFATSAAGHCGVEIRIMLCTAAHLAMCCHACLSQCDVKVRLCSCTTEVSSRLLEACTGHQLNSVGLLWAISSYEPDFLRKLQTVQSTMIVKDCKDMVQLQHFVQWAHRKGYRTQVELGDRVPRHG